MNGCQNAVMNVSRLLQRLAIRLDKREIDFRNFEKVMQVIKVHKGTHRGKAVLRLEFPRDLSAESKIRSIKQTRWSRTMNCWYLPNYKSSLLKMRQMFGETLEICFEDHGLIILNEKQVSAIEKFKSWLNSKRYSENTIKTYTDALKVVLYFFKEKTMEEINNEDYYTL